MKIEEILQKAYDNRASDIHMIPQSPLMFRIDGEMTADEGEEIRTEDIEDVLQSVLSEEQKQKLTEEGEIDFAVSISDFSRVRINIYRQRGTYAAVFHMLSQEIPLPEQLDISRAVIELTQKKKGLVLVTGGVGSGKSTTLASLIDLIAKRDTKNIITIEDPIEYMFSHKKSIISQREIGSDAKSYAGALKSALRQDPDVILVGELTDAETISMAITAAETGHLVFSSLPTNCAQDTLYRLIDVFPPYQQQQIRVQLAEVLNGIIAQQLLPRSDKKGRIAVYEVMLANKEIRNLIRDNRISQIPSAIGAGKKEGLQTMDDAILSVYMRSKITAETAVSYAQDAETMQTKIKIY